MDGDGVDVELAQRLGRLLDPLRGVGPFLAEAGGLASVTFRLADNAPLIAATYPPRENPVVHGAAVDLASARLA